MSEKESKELLRKGLTYARRTRFREAIIYYKKGISLNPKNPEGWFLMASALIETGNYTEALTYCDKAIELDPHYSDAWSKKGLALYHLERFEESLFACTRATTLNANDASAWYIKGVCLDELGKSDEAQEAYGKSLELEIIIDIEAEKKKVGRV